MRTAKDDMRAILGELQLTITRISSSVDLAQQESTAIGEKIGGILVSLQFYDSVNQVRVYLP